MAWIATPMILSIGLISACDKEPDSAPDTVSPSVAVSAHAAAVPEALPVVSGAHETQSPRPDTTGACQRDGPLLVGLLRADGVVVPFACYAPGSWQAMDSIPTAMYRVERWYAALPDSHPRWLNAGSLVRFTSGDTFYEEWGQLTDFSPRQVEANSYPLTRRGVALTREHATVWMEPLPARDPERPRLLRLMRSEFNRRDTTSARLSSTDALSATQQIQLPIRIVAAARSAEPVVGVRPVLVRAERTYPGCEIAALEAFAVERDGTLSLLAPRFERYSCTEMGRTSLHPYAILPLDGKAYLVAEEFGWEHSEKAILQITPTAAVTVVRSKVP